MTRRRPPGRREAGQGMASAGTQTISLMIRTADTAWTAAYAQPGPEPDTAVVTVPAAGTERFTFAGAAMIRFDLLAAAGCLPGDWPNRSAAVPARHQVGGCEERRTRRTGPDSPNGWICRSCEAIR